MLKKCPTTACLAFAASLIATGCQNQVSEQADGEDNYTPLSAEELNEDNPGDQNTSDGCFDPTRPAIQVKVIREGQALCHAIVTATSDTQTLDLDVVYPGGACEYRLLSAEPGTYQIVAEAMGYQTGTVEAVVVSSDDCGNWNTQSVDIEVSIVSTDGDGNNGEDTPPADDDLDEDGPDTPEEIVVPEGWTCSTSFYGSEDGCDCGCGIVDADCASLAPESCEYEQCETGFSLDPADTTQCIEEVIVDPVSTITMECPEGAAVYEGDFALETADDLTALEDYDCINGHVSFPESQDPNTGIVEIDNETLVTITGGLQLQNNAQIQSIRFRELTAVGGDLSIESAANLAEVQFDALDKISGTLRLGAAADAGLPNLDALDGFDQLIEIEGDLLMLGTAIQNTNGMGSLQTIGGDLQAEDNPPMQRLDLPALETVSGSISVSGNEQLDRVRMRLLESVDGGFHLLENGVLDEADMRGLVTVGGDLEIKDNLFSDADFTLLEQVEGYFKLSNNVDLDTLDGFELLNQIGDNLEIRENGQLPSSEVETFVSSCDLGGSSLVCGNENGTECQ
jgi:hypothetical protein